MKTKTQRKTTLGSQSGIALMMVLVSLVLLSVIIYEISGSSRVDLSISRNARDRIQAVYLAQSSVRFQLLRLTLYRDVQNLVASGAPVPVPKATIDQIWSAPLPEFPLATKKTDWPGKILGTIASEGSKIPINLIDGLDNRNSNEKIQATIRTQLTDFLKSLQSSEREDNPFEDLRVDEIVARIEDWIDPDSNKREGGDELSDYDNLDPPYRPRNDRIPRLSELRMVAGINDELYKELYPQLSVINASATFNPNYISRSRLLSFWPSFSTEDLDAIDKRRNEQPFGSKEEFETFVQNDPGIKNGQGFRFPEGFEASFQEKLFTVTGTGVVGEARRTIRATVRLETEKAAAAPSASGAAPPSGDASSQKPAKLKSPTVVFIEEGPL